MGKHLIQALPSVYALQCLTGKEDKNIVAYLFLTRFTNFFSKFHNLLLTE